MSENEHVRFDPNDLRVEVEHGTVSDGMITQQTLRFRVPLDAVTHVSSDEQRVGRLVMRTDEYSFDHVDAIEVVDDTEEGDQ